MESVVVRGDKGGFEKVTSEAKKKVGRRAPGGRFVVRNREPVLR